MPEPLTEQEVWDDLDEYAQTLGRMALIESGALFDMLMVLHEVDEDDYTTVLKLRMWVDSWIVKGGVM